MKKPVIIAVCAVVVVALIASLAFVFSNSGEEPIQTKVDLGGSWKVVLVSNNEVPTFVEDQYVVFTADSVSFYKDDLTKANTTSNYVIDDANYLKLADISREYVLDKKSDNCIRLYENAETYLALIRTASEKLETTYPTAEELEGKWDAVLKGGQPDSGSTLSFSNGELTYQGPASSASAQFAITDKGVLTAPSLNYTMYCYNSVDGVIFLFEDNGNVWEIVKAAK